LYDRQNEAKMLNLFNADDSPLEMMGLTADGSVLVAPALLKESEGRRTLSPR
jgi:hypothetical protein